MTKDATFVIIERKGTEIDGSVLADISPEQQKRIHL